MGTFDFATAQRHKATLESCGATVRIDGMGSDQTTVFRNGVNITAQGKIVDGYLSFETTKNNLTDATWVIATEPATIPGDINGDGVVNALDVKSIYNIMKQ